MTGKGTDTFILTDDLDKRNKHHGITILLLLSYIHFKHCERNR